MQHHQVISIFLLPISSSFLPPVYLHPFVFLQSWDLKGLNVGGKASPLPVTNSQSR